MRQRIWSVPLVFIWLLSLTASAFAEASTQLLEQGWDLKDAGKQQEANEVFKKGVETFSSDIEHNPKDAETYNRRGIAYLGLENYTQAIQDFTKSLDQDPKRAYVYCNRGYAYKMSGDNERAIKDFTKAIELYPEDVEAYRMRGNVYEKSGNYQQALADYLAVTLKKPNDAQAYYNMARVFALQKNAEKACLYLARSKEKGSKKWKLIYQDRDFENIKNDQCYKQIVEEK